MQTRSKILIAAASAFILGTTAIVGTSVAHDSARDGRGFEHGGGHGMMGAGRYGKHGRGGRQAMMLERFDADGDNKLTQAEIDQGIAEQLAAFDKDGDKTLTLGEFEGLWLDFMRERMVDRFQDLDADGDAAVTLEEMQSPFSRMVRRMDRNGDGMLGMDDHPRRRYDRDDD